MKNLRMQYTVGELQDEYNFIKDTVVDGVRGVYVYDSGNEGPTIGITAMTHGNEISGLAVIRFCRTSPYLQEKFVKGKIIFVINNLEATRKYFEAYSLGDDDLIKKARYVDRNMNRLPLVLDPDIKQSEVVRAIELQKIWNLFDVGFDIHSTTQESQPMIITIGKTAPELFNGFPIQNIITNIDQIQIGRPAASFYGGDKNISTLEIEAGSHFNPNSFDCAITCVKQFLRNLGVTSETMSHKKSEYNVYEVCASLMVPNISYQLSRIFPMYGKIDNGEVLAKGDDGDITIDFDGHSIMAPNDTIIRDIHEEVIFITKPVKKIRI